MIINYDTLWDTIMHFRNNNYANDSELYIHKLLVPVLAIVSYTQVGSSSSCTLLDVTEQGHTPEDPVVRVGGIAGCGWGTQGYSCDIRQVRATRLLVDGAHVELGVLGVLS